MKKIKWKGLFLKFGLFFIYFILVFGKFNLSAQPSKLMAIDIQTGRVLLDTINLAARNIRAIDTLRFKFDAFSEYDRVFDTRHACYILECDTALLVINADGSFNKSIHKPSDIAGLAYDPLGDRIYCVLWRTNSYSFASLDIVSGVFTIIKSLSDNSLHSSAIDYDNRFYYIVSDTRGLLKIDLLTGAKMDSVKYFTTNNCRCNVFDLETGKIATTCLAGGKNIMQLYHPVKKTFEIIDTLNKYGSGYFSFESAVLDQNTGNWYLNLGKSIGIKNIRTNSRMDTFNVPFNRVRCLALHENLCYRPLVNTGFASQNPTCPNASDGTLRINLTGGRKPYFYAIDGKGFDTASVFRNLKKGKHAISVKDKHGFCNLSFNGLLDGPDSFLINSIINNNKCHLDSSGSIMLSVLGATKPYVFAMDGHPFTGDSLFKGLNAGVYNLYIRDFHGCIDTLENQKIDGPSAVKLDTLDLKHVSCFGEGDGSVLAMVSGGNAPYWFALGNNAFTSNGKFEDLTAGNYLLRIKDSLNCPLGVNFRILEPPSFTSEVVVKNIQCYGDADGSVYVVVNGGNDTNSYNFRVIGLSGNYRITDTVKSLKPAVYELVVSNQNGCSDSLEFTITEPLPFALPPIKDTTLCIGQYISLDLSHPEAESHSLVTNTGLSFSTDTLKLDKAGNYYLKVMSKNGCAIKDTFTINKIDMTVTHDFLVPSLAFLTDTVYAVNISHPPADMDRWLVNGADKGSSNQSTFIMQFSDTGEYQITLSSRFRECGYELTKPVTIASHSDSSRVDQRFGYAGPMIQEFEVYANPHDGQNFRIRVQLRDSAAFSIYKINPGNGLIGAEMSFEKLKSHEFTAFTSTRSEVYYLKLVVGRESKTIKVVAVR